MARMCGLDKHVAKIMNDFEARLSRVGSGALAATVECISAQFVPLFWTPGIPSTISDLLMAHAKGKTVRSAVVSSYSRSL